MANLEMPAMGHSTYSSMPFQPDAADLQAGQNMLLRAQAIGLRDRRVVFNDERKEAEMPKMTERRLVQVFVVDPDPNVPIADCLLYRGELQLTELTDQELFYEIDIKTILEKHNTKRITITNKSVKERVEKLEPARIRDLRMQIVLVAQF